MGRVTSVFFHLLEIEAECIKVERFYPVLERV
jgi:hypothetical protein